MQELNLNYNEASVVYGKGQNGEPVAGIKFDRCLSDEEIRQAYRDVKAGLSASYNPQTPKPTDTSPIPKFVLPAYDPHSYKCDDYLEQVLDAIANHYNKYVVDRLNNQTTVVAEPYELFDCLRTLKPTEPPTHE